MYKDEFVSMLARTCYFAQEYYLHNKDKHAAECASYVVSCFLSKATFVPYGENNIKADIVLDELMNKEWSVGDWCYHIDSILDELDYDNCHYHCE